MTDCKSTYPSDDLSSPPPWADTWGTDDHGTFATLRLGDLTHRFRWIPPGRFRMGSPESEAGRGPFEGPQHDVTLTQGFWLGETPCTQDLWQAVMGWNASQFQSPRRPVECIAFEDCEAFFYLLREKVPGLPVRLPTEAEWEYACRAGTETTTYAGDPDLQQEDLDPVLDRIAWYVGNSWRDFDHESGVEVPEWLEEAGLKTPAGTRLVGLKQPNAWGLFDMLGNVAEWCQDAWDATSPYGGEARVDPLITETDRIRVARGGRWGSSVTDLRAADRGWYFVHEWGISLGLRLAIDAKPQPEVPSTASDLPVSLHVAAPDPSRPRADLAELASSTGEDAFGAWAILDVGEITVRMRWIPPGQFWMGTNTGREISLAEGPRHLVTWTHGYWLSEFLVTQDLWQSVTGSNPSHFVSPRRPVEQVSWNDCQAFLLDLNARHPGLALRLPTEAEWEYACRAGTEEPTYAGTPEILGLRNATLLDEIAWYAGNCGHEFDLDTGKDLSGWEERQYPGDLGGTRMVGLKKPNPWGLYDMLGNVLEWCLDYVVPDLGYPSAEPRVDPPPNLLGPGRIVRGGSWYWIADGVQAVERGWERAGERSFTIGFRLAHD